MFFIEIEINMQMSFMWTSRNSDSRTFWITEKLFLCTFSAPAQLIFLSPKTERLCRFKLCYFKNCRWLDCQNTRLKKVNWKKKIHLLSEVLFQPVSGCQKSASLKKLISKIFRMNAPQQENSFIDEYTCLWCGPVPPLLLSYRSWSSDCCVLLMSP